MPSATVMPMADEKAPIGENIRRYREALNLSQEELAARCGLSKQAIYMAETGQSYPRVGSLTRIAAALGVNLIDLYARLDTGGEPPLPSALAAAVELMKAGKAGIEPPNAEEIKQLLEVRFRGAPTSQTYIFLLMALRQNK